MSVLRVGGLADGSVAAGWRPLAIVGGILAVGLMLLFGMLTASRRRAEERRQLEVPPFSAEQFQRFCDQQQWVAQQPVPPPVERPGFPPVERPGLPPASGTWVPPASGTWVPPASGTWVPPASGKRIPPAAR
jgi:hypothetical protein